MRWFDPVSRYGREAHRKSGGLQNRVGEGSIPSSPANSHGCSQCSIPPKEEIKAIMRRSDPYQERARELATAAGLDPDGRIERPGQRSMPVWCSYRDAAHAEHMAKEAAATAAELPPQSPRFQNSPLKIFGQHDEATVAQMR